MTKTDIKRKMIGGNNLKCIFGGWEGSETTISHLGIAETRFLKNLGWIRCFSRSDGNSLRWLNVKTNAIIPQDGLIPVLIMAGFKYEVY